MIIKKSARSYTSTEHYKKVKRAEVEMNKRIRGMAKEEYHDNHLGLGLFAWVCMLFILGLALFTGVSVPFALMILIFLIFPILCECYGVIVAGFTILSGIKLFFSGQYFAIAPVLPFTVYNLPLSYFCLGWGLLVASKRSRSKLGFLMATANLLGGVLDMFHFQQSTFIVAPGYWGSAISGISTVFLGLSMIQVVIGPWSKSRAA